MLSYDELYAEYMHLSKDVAEIQRRRSDIAIQLTRVNQLNAQSIESQPEEESLTGSEQPDSTRTGSKPS